MKRPHIIINCAMSADGKIASPLRRQIRISSEEDIARVHRLRNLCDAILVGVGTVISDNPKLTVKDKYVKKPRHPIRIVLDSHLRVPKDALILDGSSKTMVFTLNRNKKEDITNNPNVEVIVCKTDAKGQVDIKEVLSILYKRGVKKLLVEGGSTVIWEFISNGLVDDLYVYIGSCIIGGADTPTLCDGEGIKTLSPINLQIISTKRLGSGLLIHYKLT
ncbi:MAG: 2,5-diamino-6-(ribosylamino)-4(3H)-pyrimidinone 5'-phosphate reductase [Candidatus Thermoplasmatota archaeon]